MADTFADRLKAFGRNVKQKSQTVIDTQRLNMEIASEENRQSVLFEQYGRAMFARLADQPDETIDPLLREARAVQMKIDAGRARLDELRKAGRCENCGEKLPREAAFCPSCGAKVARETPEPANEAEPEAAPEPAPEADAFDEPAAEPVPETAEPSVPEADAPKQ